MALLRLILNDLEDVANAKFLSVLHAQDDAASRTSADRWVRGISRGAALASVDEEGTSSAHLAGLLRVQVE